MRVLNLRAMQQSEQMSALLKQAGMEEVVVPCLEIRAVAEIAALCSRLVAGHSESLLVFTSQNGVTAVQEHLQLEGRACIAIGKKTRALLESLNANVVFCPTSANSETLASEMLTYLSQMHTAPPHLLLLRGNTATESLPALLSEAGLNFSSEVVYESICPQPSREQLQWLAESLELRGKEASGTSVAIAATSGFALSNLELMLESLAADRGTQSKCTQWRCTQWKTALHDIPVFCIGPRTTAVARKLGFGTVIVAKEATVESLVNKLIEYCTEQ